jgi:hypothetical protein
VSEASEEVPPPRYEQRGGWKHIICDEQEWLARPNPWGIEELPIRVRRRKQNLYEYYFRQRLVASLTCEICRPSIAELCGEQEPTCDAGSPSTIRAWYTRTHPPDEPKCDAWPVWKVFLHYQRGILNLRELRNGLADKLLDAVGKPPHSPDGIEWRRALGAWSRVIALELIGPNPFRPLTFSSAWRTDTAVALASQMYESRDFSAMPILADALQDAGCDNDAILSHCRDTSLTHVRGCWVVDFVLGKS